ncbi:uncharacterized protein LOC6051359 [Culex quinquefasciatus]|uniref:uncharacterized protein LOC6051359 n=1 Tax=Culex quinquefasciatus TaxID=7176 RepID=UPI0018E3B4FC|nr:uncharacterized protein LOC6051359 [Culex quinquefasciatus]
MQAIWSLRWTGVILLLSVCGVCGDDPVFRCRDYLRYLTLNTCIIQNVDLDAASDLGELSFPREMDLEFRNARFRFLGVELFQLMGDTRQLTLRGGFTREIIFWSVSIEVLRVINTDLVMFDVLGEPNYSLKQLAIRSALFSRWSPSMMYLKALEVIDVAYCNFTYFDLDRVGGFKNLRVLDLSNNKLQALHSGPFLKLERLEELYLQGNQLEFMWRFPDVVPGLKYITVSDNRWSCNWVVMARNTFWLMKVTLMDSDYSCGAGWENSGGLCCKPSKVVLNVEDTAKLDPYVQGGVLDILIEENDNETQAVGAEMGNSAVYLDDPIAV